MTPELWRRYEAIRKIEKTKPLDDWKLGRLWTGEGISWLVSQGPTHCYASVREVSQGELAELINSVDGLGVEIVLRKPVQSEMGNEYCRRMRRY